MQAIAYIQIRKVATATIRPMGESPCSSAVSIQSSSFRIDLLLNFADKVLGVLNEKLCVGSIATDLYAAVFVRESHASVRSPLGTERAAQCVHFEIRVCLQQSNSLAEILKGDVMQPGGETSHTAAGAHVLAGVSAALQVDALSDLQFVLVVDGFEGHGFLPLFGSP